MTTPKISVIVPCYNQVNFIREALDSILSQDHSDFEVVVSDDGSTDGTQDVVREYAAAHPGKLVAILHPRNQGITINSNAALSAARGELISLMAGDDVLLPGKLSAQSAVFDRNTRVVLSYHPVEIFDSDTGRILYVTNQRPHEEIRGVEDIILKSGIPGAASVMVRRSAIPPGGFDERIPSVCDWLFFIEVGLQGEVFKVDRVLGRYRKHSSGATAKIGDLLDETLRVLDLALLKHPGAPRLAEICRRGKARYLAGEAFRRMNGDAPRARELAQSAAALDPQNWRYKALAALTRFESVSAAVGPLLNRGKYVIKKLTAYNSEV